MPSLRTVRASGTGLEWKQAITKALAKVPADRFATAGEFVASLDRAARAVTVPLRSARVRSRWLLIGAGAVALLALAIGYARRQSASAVPSRPEVVAILPFRIAGASAELSWLHEGVVDLLSIKLDGGGSLRSAEPTSVLSVWRRVAASESTAISSTAALEVARGLGAGRLIEGSVVGTAEHLTITASLLTLPGGRTRARASAAGAGR